MEGSIINSVFFVMSVAALYAGVFRVKKSDQPLNGMIWVMMNFIAVLCWGTFTAGILNIVRIPINIVSMGVIYLASAVVLFLKAHKDREVQKYEWKKYDMLYTIVIGCVIFILLVIRITPSLEFVFNNSDAAVHLRNSLTVLRTGKLDTMYFAPMHNALITEIFLPFIEKVNTYKVFLVVDGVTFILECVFFMAAVREYLHKKAAKVLGILICFVYIFGYPFHSYLLSFFYWGIGVLLIEYVIILLREYTAENIKQDTVVFLLMTGCASITMCYMLFGPVSYVAMFLCMCVYFRRKHTLFTWNTVKICLQIFLIPCILSVYYCYFMFLKKQNLSIEGALTLQGGIYGELFINFIWVMPFVVYRFIRAIKKKRLDENMIFLICFVLMVLTIGLLAVIGKASAYYYFKFYYPVWMLCFMITAQSIEEIYEEHRELLMAGMIVAVFLAVVSASNLEEKVQRRGIGAGDRTSVLFDIFYNNINTYRTRIIVFDDDYLEACNYIMDTLGKDENVPMVSTIDNYVHCYWYEALTGEDSKEFYGWDYGMDVLMAKLDKQEVNYFIICKEYPVYTRHKKYFDSFHRIYENDKVFIAETKNRKTGTSK